MRARGVLGLQNVPLVMVNDKAQGVSETQLNPFGNADPCFCPGQVNMAGLLKKVQKLFLLADKFFEYRAVKLAIDGVHTFEGLHLVEGCLGEHALSEVVAQPAAFEHGTSDSKPWLLSEFGGQFPADRNCRSD